ncbi:MAG: YbhB/YbcL family Raf kinase inhibitor-like protein [Acidilobus sp.]
MPKEYVIREGVTFTLTTPSFQDGGAIPRRHTCDGEDVSPRLEWNGVPSGTRSLALIMYDPDAPAGTFIHWVLYNIPSAANAIPEDVQKEIDDVPGVGLQGLNDFGYVGYGGPCPPRGHGPHRYYFALHALSVGGLSPRRPVTAQRLLEAMRGKVLGHAVLMGRYERGRG